MNSRSAAILSGRSRGVAYVAGTLHRIDTGISGRDGEWVGGRAALTMRAGEMHGALPRAGG